MSSRVLTPFCFQGSKLRELSRLKKIIPPSSYICEPFAGSGIVFGNLGATDRCLVNDLNTDISEIWKRTVANDNEFFKISRELMREQNRTPEFYYEMRDLYNEKWREDDWSPSRTALFYFLLNSCHAGMLRYGPNGFNTSYKIFLSQGRKYNVDERLYLLRTFAKKISYVGNKDGVDFIRGGRLDSSFKGRILIYCDPPYTTSAAKYDGTWNDDKLLELDETLAYFSKRGVRSVMSNYRNEELLSKMSFDDRDDFITTRMGYKALNTVKKHDVVLTYGFSIPRERKTLALEFGDDHSEDHEQSADQP